MPTVAFTANLQRHVKCPPQTVQGSTVRKSLAAAFAGLDPAAAGYVLDEQGALRTHVIVFVDGEPVQDRVGLTDPVPEDAEVYVMQALSGG